MACQCYIFQNTAIKEKGNFALKTGFNIEDMLVDIFYWLDKSKSTKFIKHGPTCFLSQESAVALCKKLYPLLKS